MLFLSMGIRLYSPSLTYAELEKYDGEWRITCTGLRLYKGGVCSDSNTLQYAKRLAMLLMISQTETMRESMAEAREEIKSSLAALQEEKG